MGMIFGRDAGEIFLGGSEGLHMKPGLRCIKIHEDTAFSLRFVLRINSLGPRECEGGLHIVNVGTATKRGRDRFRAISKRHFLRPDNEGHVAHPCLDVSHRLDKRGCPARTGILDIHYWNTAYTKRP